MDSSFTLKEISILKNSPLKYKSTLGHSLIYFRKGSCIVNIYTESFIASHHSYILLRDEEQLLLTNDHTTECTIYILSFSYNHFDNSSKDLLLECFDKKS